MSYIINLLILSLILISYSPYSGAAAKEEFYGETRLDNKKFVGEVEVMGPLTFNNLRVKGALVVNGSLTSNGPGKFYTLDVHGPAEVSYIMAGEMHVHGTLRAKNIQISEILTVHGSLEGKDITVKTLQVSGEKVNCQDCSIEKLIMLDPKTRQKQIVTLGGDTFIGSDIIFQSSLGEVVVQGKTVKMKKVVGGFLHRAQ